MKDEDKQNHVMKINRKNIRGLTTFNSSHKFLVRDQKMITLESIEIDGLFRRVKWDNSNLQELIYLSTHQKFFCIYRKNDSHWGLGLTESV